MLKYIDQVTILEKDTIGMSPAKVYRCQYQDEICYLKMVDNKYSRTTYSIKREAEVMQWLDGKVNVPKVLEYGQKEGVEYLIMSELKGKSIDDFADDPLQFVTYYARAVKQLQAVDISDCPFSTCIDMRLEVLKYLLENELADTNPENWEDTTEFTDPQELYQWLCANKPQEEFVLSHGDISNLIIRNGEIYFFDLPACGLADKWFDIAMCVREIRYFYHNPEYEKLFFELLGIEPDDTKINYFLLLDELF